MQEEKRPGMWCLAKIALVKKILDFTQKSRVTDHILDVMSTITNTRFVWTIGNATSVNKQRAK